MTTNFDPNATPRFYELLDYTEKLSEISKKDAHQVWQDQFKEQEKELNQTKEKLRIAVMYIMERRVYEPEGNIALKQIEQVGQ